MKEWYTPLKRGSRIRAAAASLMLIEDVFPRSGMPTPLNTIAAGRMRPIRVRRMIRFSFARKMMNPAGKIIIIRARLSHGILNGSAAARAGRGGGVGGELRAPERYLPRMLRVGLNFC